MGQSVGGRATRSRHLRRRRSRPTSNSPDHFDRRPNERRPARATGHRGFPVQPAPAIRSGVDGLTTDQAATIGKALGPALGFLARLVERMDRTNLRMRDLKLYRLVRAAEDAMHALTVE